MRILFAIALSLVASLTACAGFPNVKCGGISPFGCAPGAGEPAVQFQPSTVPVR